MSSAFTDNSVTAALTRGRRPWPNLRGPLGALHCAVRHCPRLTRHLVPSCQTPLSQEGARGPGHAGCVPPGDVSEPPPAVRSPDRQSSWHPPCGSACLRLPVPPVQGHVCPCDPHPPPHMPGRTLGRPEGGKPQPRPEDSAPRRPRGCREFPLQNSQWGLEPGPRVTARTTIHCPLRSRHRVAPAVRGSAPGQRAAPLGGVLLA